ncbi:MAG: substrate-binding domain-containing protein [Desulfovibrio sp.]|nr:substrate-binding domain-containing protein [Desulfovibrio sp.]MCA1985580.1 substrate-binding domain-containing protein [Desulfovibrio sp.]
MTPSSFSRITLTALLGLLGLLACLAGGCSDTATPLESISILACPEVQRVEPAILQAARARKLDVQLRYKPPVDIMQDLQTSTFPCDAVLTGNLPWLTLGDPAHHVREEASIMHSPVALGVRRDLAASLGWQDREVPMAEIWAAVRDGRLTMAMASATQSSSGAAAYMGMLFALAGKPEMLEPRHLQDAALQDRLRRLLHGVCRTAGGSQLLTDVFFGSPTPLAAILNEESQLLAINQALTTRGEEPLHLVYPADGLAVADFTLGFVERPDNKHKLERFIELRNHLLEPDAQQAFAALGFRTALQGMNPKLADASLFRPEWGVDLARPLTLIRWPAPESLREALDLYQTSLRRPSATVYLLDARPQSLRQRQEALAALLEPSRVARAMLQPTPQDVVMVLPFGQAPDDARQPESPWVVHGNAPEALEALQRRIDALPADASPAQVQGQAPALDLDQALAQARDWLQTSSGQGLASIILLADADLVPGDISPAISPAISPGTSLPPVSVVLTGTREASADAFEPLATATGGRVFDGRILGPAAALRLAKGGN